MNGPARERGGASRPQGEAPSPSVDVLAAQERRVMWRVSDRADPVAVKLADRHYNRQHVGSPQFVPPGRNLCFTLVGGDAVWTTSWPFAEYVKHAWAGAWVNSIFRNESPYLSSDLILDAISATRWTWEPPQLGIVTFVDADKVRRKRDPGRCYRRAGFEHVGFTKGGLWAFQMLPDAMPEPLMPLGAQMSLAAARLDGSSGE